MIDTHAHLFFPDFSEDLETVLARAKDAGIHYVINAGTNRETSWAAVQMANAHPNVFALVGVHPHDVNVATSDGLAELEMWLKEEPKVLGIGEVGLDYYRCDVPTALQREALINFLRMAERYHAPIALHIRDAYDDAIQIVRDFCETPVKAIAHCFSGKPEDLERLIPLGFYISFSGSVTYPKSDLLRESVRMCPIGRLLVETDSPYLAPQSMRGKRNEPAFVAETIRLIAELKNMPAEDLSRRVLENARALFDPAAKFLIMPSSGVDSSPKGSAA